MNKLSFLLKKNPVVSKRAKKLNIYCLQGIENKRDVLLKFCQENDYELEHAAYVGNDINDKEVMGIVGFTFCPFDAHDSIKRKSNHILDTKGGNGVIRELLDFITSKKGK